MRLFEHRYYTRGVTVLPPSDTITAGSVYVKGIFVCVNDKLRRLGISVNCTQDNINVTRDRDRLERDWSLYNYSKWLARQDAYWGAERVGPGKEVSWAWAAASCEEAACVFEELTSLKDFIQVGAGDTLCMVGCACDATCASDAHVTLHIQTCMPGNGHRARWHCVACLGSDAFVLPLQATLC